MGEALDWASRIMAVALEMVLPGLAGHWLDGRFGTSFLVLVGFIFGLTIGVWHLLLMTRAADRRSRPNPDEEDPQ
jgi:hypothetical protein